VKSLCFCRFLWWQARWRCIAKSNPKSQNSLGQVMSGDNDGMTTMKINEALKMRYRQQGYWGDATLADYWHLSAKASADKIAVSDNHGTAYTYRELDNAAERWRCGLWKRYPAG
jgi:hypothetical protein